MHSSLTILSTPDIIGLLIVFGISPCGRESMQIKCTKYVEKYSHFLAQTDKIALLKTAAPKACECYIFPTVYWFGFKFAVAALWITILQTSTVWLLMAIYINCIEIVLKLLMYVHVSN